MIQMIQIPMPVLLPVPNLMNRFRKIQAGVDVEASGSGPEEEAAVAVKQAAWNPWRIAGRDRNDRLFECTVSNCSLELEQTGIEL